MLRFDHLGIIVQDLALGREHLSAAFDVQAWTAEFEDPFIQVRVQFGRDPSGFCYETVAPFGQSSPIARALKTGNPILNHVAYLTFDLNASAERMRSLGYMPAGVAMPAVAYGGKKVQFFLSPLRFIVELIDAFDHRHDFEFSA